MQTYMSILAKLILMPVKTFCTKEAKPGRDLCYLEMTKAAVFLFEKRLLVLIDLKETKLRWLKTVPSTFQDVDFDGS